MSRKNEKKYKIEISLERTPGEIVAIRRKKLGWSQEELSWVCAVSVSQISRIERGLCNPTFETIEKLEAALEVDLLDLFLKYRNSDEQKNQQNRTSRTAMDDFKLELARRKLPEDELKEILERALRLTTGSMDDADQ